MFFLCCVRVALPPELSLQLCIKQQKNNFHLQLVRKKEHRSGLKHSLAAQVFFGFGRWPICLQSSFFLSSLDSADDSILSLRRCALIFRSIDSKFPRASH